MYPRTALSQLQIRHWKPDNQEHSIRGRNKTEPQLETCSRVGSINGGSLRLPRARIIVLGSSLWPARKAS